MTYARQSHVVFKLRSLLEHLLHFYLLLTVKRRLFFVGFLLDVYLCGWIL